MMTLGSSVTSRRSRLQRIARRLGIAMLVLFPAASWASVSKCDATIDGGPGCLRVGQTSYGCCIEVDDVEYLFNSQVDIYRETADNLLFVKWYDLGSSDYERCDGLSEGTCC